MSVTDVSPSRSRFPLSRTLRDVGGARWLAVVIGICVLAAVFGALSPTFLTIRNVENIAVQASATGVMAVGMTFVILTAGIDISVGAILLLTAAVAARVSGDLSAPAAILPTAAAFGLVLGAVNGLLSTTLRITPLIATLATFSIYRGLALNVTDANILLAPDSLRAFGESRVVGFPAPVLIAVVTGLVGAAALRFTRFGRYVLAVGASPQSARETLLPVRRVLVTVYAIAGLCAALGALILVGRAGTVQSNLGIGTEFTVITAVVLGGTSLSGGRGTVVGSMAGAVLLVMVDNGLNQLDASPFLYDVVRGGVLIAAVGLDRATRLRLARARLRERRRAEKGQVNP